MIKTPIAGAITPNRFYTAAGKRALPMIPMRFGHLLDGCQSVGVGTLIISSPTVTGGFLVDLAPDDPGPSADAWTAGTGWRAAPAGQGWRTYTRAGGRSVVNPWTIRVCVLSPGVVARCPILTPSNVPMWPMELCRRLDGWTDLVGSPYHGIPGVAGTAALRDIVAAGKARAPLWLPENTQGRQVPDRVHAAALERDYTTSWKPPTVPAGPTITLDVNRAYLAAALGAVVARDRLTPRTTTYPGTSRDTTRAGYYLIDADPWQEPRMPDPLGYIAGNRPQTRLRWVTAPTLDLIDELHLAGQHGGYTITEEYTAPGYRILRPWAERIRDALAATNDPATVATLKAAYRETIGLLGRPGGRIHRPDWQSTIIALSRSVMWRKLYALAIATDRWPLAVNVDAVTLPGDTVPDAWTIDPAKLGAWKIKEVAA